MNVLEQLKREEDEILHVYKDSLGYWTIGAGICVDLARNCGLLQEESAFITANRIHIAQVGLAHDYPWFPTLNEPRQAALVLMYHQLGRDGLFAFKKMHSAIRDERWAEAEFQALDSLWAKQTPARAHRMAHQIATGEWR